MSYNVPSLLLGRVMHRRLRPKVHGFSYAVYQLRLPLRSWGQGDFAPALLSRNHFNLLSFHDRDHGDGQTPLVPWVDAILQENGIHDAQGEIWLHCFPRVLGYAFNPVSFWFCHREDGAVRAILCEVNNTFGERHCYLLFNPQGLALENDAQLQAAKIFHVSPFCQVKGRYDFRFAQEGGAHRAIINYDDGQGLLLLTSITARQAALTNSALWRQFITKPLMTWGVVLRIHWHALRLWLKRVPFHSKPQPPIVQVSS